MAGNENYLVESIEISQAELFARFSNVIRDKLIASNYEHRNAHILIWTPDNTKRNWYDEVYYGFCEDCNQLGMLKWEDACADGDHCCTKLICIDKCLVFCSCGNPVYYETNGYYIFNNKINDNTGDKFDHDNSTIMCDKCGDSIPVHFLWWGLSPKEHMRKYG